MIYRLYRPEDFAALYAIEELCFQPPFRFGRGFMRSLIDDVHSATWIAEADGQLAGFAVVDWRREEAGLGHVPAESVSGAGADGLNA